VECSNCGATLAPGALFCGECGRSTREAVAAPVMVDAAEQCVQCGADLAPTDIFCGECGFVRPSVTARRKPESDTRVLDPFPWGAPVDEQTPAAPSPAPAPPAVAPEPAPIPPVADTPSEPAMLPSAPPPLVAPPTPTPSYAAPASLPSAPLPSAPRIPVLDDDEVDDTRLVDRSGRGDRFVLQFSTGESISVTGTGLIGRNPIAEPGEYFDAFVTVVDPGRSVSKTHVEFGQESGSFWLSDRWSGNGTIVREPDRPPRRCEPGKRYRVVRGSRVDIGEQFFIIS
jgi:hypothetical protein